ncbi:MAG: TadE/TadG family type IV pilus assembly protein [Anaerolineales bacterium]
MNNSKKNGSERGQSLVELAVSLTFILLLLSGVVDLGRAFFTYMALRDAAQEGALYGSIDPGDTYGIETRIYNSSNMLSNLKNDPGATTTVQVKPLGSSCAGNGIEVHVAYNNFPLTMPFMGTIAGHQTIRINATVTDTILSPICGQ